ncbi:hypothetical protein Desor_2045 [Desulfosporosinus orientis DSM 765]|uniref:Uncharacterized protein n=1 Tax=Desulfosporosinus orientis (strain ATCC 19365 / DSM 765 / NCIMB 8382 / VKM B-1628 / Singapore I) TaxID=768706 RepID=G7WF43_DESOD|nr:hypothetical protein [Desulfosporosinus orientis]AET67654.1 hypothetical protein Desor_2045 [Desulfosporosinus orientis DSM 765]
MIIDRIRILNHEKMADLDLRFSQGPVVIKFAEISQQKLFYELLFSLLFNRKDSLVLQGLKQNTSVEIWVLEEFGRFHIRFEYQPKKGDWELDISIGKEDYQFVCLLEGMSPGNYFFKCKEQTFFQGRAIQWPEYSGPGHLLQRIRNLRQGGDDELSVSKVRASIAGALKRLKDQQEGMEQVKAECEVLRSEWESIHRQQEEERLMQIEIKNLQEKADILADRIAVTKKIQDRINCLLENPDYRELRHLQEEINGLEERRQYLNTALGANSDGSCVDWGIIESYREECAEWAGHQKNVDYLELGIKNRQEKVLEIEQDLQLSGYQGFQEDEDEQLRKVVQEREIAQEKCRKLGVSKRVLHRLENLLAREKSQAEDLEIMAAVTTSDIEWILHKEKQLAKWRNSKLGGFLDGTLKKRMGVKSIAETLSSHLLHYYKSYQTSNYEEFTNKLEKYRTQQQRIQKIKGQILQVQAKINQEQHLRRMETYYSQRIEGALKAVHAADFAEWLRGWKNFKQKKEQISLDRAEITTLREKLSLEEKNLAACTEGLREKLKNWDIPTSNREEVLAAVLNLSALLHEKREADREISAYSEKYQRLLGERNMEQLSEKLEPLAELERELCFSPEERLADITTWTQEHAQLQTRINALKQRLQRSPVTSNLTLLEKKITKLKGQWTAYEDLGHALEEAQALLELSWQEWQTNHEPSLNREKQWISEHTFSLTALRSGNEEIQALRNYFAYRMAVAQLALGVNTDIPLFFSVGNIKSGLQSFWEDATNYLQTLALSRQIFFFTTDPELEENLAGKGWAALQVEI